MPGSTVPPENSATGQPSGADAAAASTPMIWPSAHKTSAPPGITARPSKALSARIASLPVPRFAVTSPITFSSSFLT
jgi:hypothetical protein